MEEVYLKVPRQDTSTSVPVYVRKKALNHRRKSECTCAWMTGKSSDVKFVIRFSTRNMGSMLGKWGEISETLKRHSLNICCLQEERWKGHQVKMIENGFKFLWNWVCKAENSVGAIVVYWLIEKFVGVERHNDRVMKVSIVIGDVVWEVISCYCPQAGRSVNEKEEFHEWIKLWKVSKYCCAVILINGNVGRDMVGFGEVHEGFGIEKINNGGITLLDWAVGKGLYLLNACFQKRKLKQWLIKFLWITGTEVMSRMWN